MLSTPRSAKSLAYNSIIHPIMDYGCQVWNPHQHGKIDLLERVYMGPARWSCGSQWDPVTLSWSKSSEACLTDLSWPSLLLCQQYLSIVALYDIATTQMLSSKLLLTIALHRAHVQGNMVLIILPIQPTISAYLYSLCGTLALPFYILSIPIVKEFHHSLQSYLFITVVSFHLCVFCI